MPIDTVKNAVLINTQTDRATSKPSATLSEDDGKRAKLKKATQEFEGVFIGMMLKQMRKSMAGSSPLFGGSYESKYYQEMVDEKVAQQMSSSGSFGLAKTLYKSMEHTLGLEVISAQKPQNVEAAIEKMQNAVQTIKKELDQQKTLAPVSSASNGQVSK